MEPCAGTVPCTAALGRQWCCQLLQIYGTFTIYLQQLAVGGICRLLPCLVARLAPPAPPGCGALGLFGIHWLGSFPASVVRHQVESQLGSLSADAQLVEQYLVYMGQARAAKRQRTAGGAAAGAGAGGAGTGTVTGAGPSAAPAQGTAVPPSPTRTPTSSHAGPAGGTGAAAEQRASSPECVMSDARPASSSGGTAHGVPAGGAGAVGAAAAGSSQGQAPSQGHPALLWSEQHQAAHSRWCRISSKYEQLEPVFLERRRQPLDHAAEPPAAVASRRRHADAGGLPEQLTRFAEDLSHFATFTTLTPLASLRYSDALTSSSMVCGTAFDRDDEFFAVAGVSKRIKIYEKDRVLKSNVGLHYPLMEISSRSRLSSVTWSSYIKSHLASADYEGVVQLWDANTNSELVQFEEHSKRVWSIDFSQVRGASGSDKSVYKGCGRKSGAFLPIMCSRVVRPCRAESSIVPDVHWCRVLP